MTVDEIVEVIEGVVVTKTDADSLEIEYAMASDLMSDVLTLDTENAALITGLSNIQTIRTVEMQDIQCIILARGKRATAEMIKLAEQDNITIIESPYAMYRISGVLYQAGIKPHY